MRRSKRPIQSSFWDGQGFWLLYKRFGKGN
ncbi:hypothetical protein [Streptococcus suis]